VLDEPTNDLDAETLELLEELLQQYAGTLLLVSHDREFLNNVVTSTLVLAGDGEVREYVGGYDDWLRQAAAESQVALEASACAVRQPQVAAQRRRTAEKPKADLQGGATGSCRTESLSWRRSRDTHQTLVDPAYYRIAGEAAKLTARLCSWH
jgi:ATP-binding cassette subfamily F protein uup